MFPSRIRGRWVIDSNNGFAERGEGGGPREHRLRSGKRQERRAERRRHGSGVVRCKKLARIFSRQQQQMETREGAAR